VEYTKRSARLPDLVGLRHLARLLAELRREFHVLDLVAESGVVPAGERAEGAAGRAGAGLPVLDDVARSAYRRRLAEIEEDLDQAEADHDLARIALAERDREYLLAELRRDVGLGGRPRTTGSYAERARTAVARALRYAIGRLRHVHPELASPVEHRAHRHLLPLHPRPQRPGDLGGHSRDERQRATPGWAKLGAAPARAAVG
jgi:hypothetical protein